MSGPEHPEAANEPRSSWCLLILSADSQAELETATAALLDELKDDDAGRDLAVIEKDLQRTAPKKHRRILVGSGRDDAIAVLESRDEKRMRDATADDRPPVTFLFSGQGAQYPGMGRGLYESQPVFRHEVDRCCELFLPHLGRDLRELLYPADDSDADVATELNQTRNTQPALFVIEWATAQLWRSWGVEPEVMIGHSIGEYAVACVAGVLTLEEAISLVAARGRLMQSLPSGAMLAVPLTEEKLEPWLDDQLSVAATNAPNRLVVSGPHEAIAAFRDRLRGERVLASPLHTSHAFHSVMMEPILEPFLEEVRKVALRPPQIPYVSNLTGDWIRDAQATDPDYYAQHLRRAVRYSEGLERIFAEPGRVLLEVGPGKTLVTLAQRHPQKAAGKLLQTSIRHPKDRAADDLAFVLAALGNLWLAGVEPDWARLEGV